MARNEGYFLTSVELDVRTLTLKKKKDLLVCRNFHYSL